MITQETRKEILLVYRSKLRKKGEEVGAGKGEGSGKGEGVGKGEGAGTEEGAGYRKRCW